MGVAIDFDKSEMPMQIASVFPRRPGFVVRTGTLTFDASYPNTGGTVGEPLTAAMLQLDSVLYVKVENSAGQVMQYDYANSVVHVYRSDSDGVADGPLVERADTTDLSALAPKFLVIGKLAYDSALP